MPSDACAETCQAATIETAACGACIIVASVELLIMWQLDVALVASRTELLWQQVEALRIPSQAHRELNGLIKQVD